MKDILVLFTTVLIFASCGVVKKRDQQKQQQNQQIQKTDSAVKIHKDQYRIAENLKDSKNQIIDLIQGTSVFEINYEGEGRFLAQLKYVDGKLLTILADRTGSFRDKKTIEIPQTTAYILEVECTGYWSVYRE